MNSITSALPPPEEALPVQVALASEFSHARHTSPQQVSEDVLSAYERCTAWMCCVLSHSVVSDSAAPWAVAHQAPLPTESSRPEYWSGQPFPSPGNLPNPGIKPRSPTLQVDSSPSEPPGKPNFFVLFH